MKFKFCTLFDRNYLFKGVTLYNSLLKHCPDFTLWILCMDDLTYEILGKLHLGRASLIKIYDFEDEVLRGIKPTRSVAEYCWTCTPSLPLYVLKNNPSLEMITYLDADLFFFSDPSPIYDEMGNDSIMIVEHRFPERLKELEENGIYNVSVVSFRNNAEGLKCLKWWRDRCNEWCYYRLEDGKMGDQKYLDDWPTRFRGVHVLQHKGAGVALWNIMRYTTREVNEKTFIDEEPLIVYHFHQFHILSNKSYDYGTQSRYSLTEENIRIIYEPYVAEIERSIKQVKEVSSRFSYGYTKIKHYGIVDRFRQVIKTVLNQIGIRKQKRIEEI